MSCAELRAARVGGWVLCMSEKIVGTVGDVGVPRFSLSDGDPARRRGGGGALNLRFGDVVGDTSAKR